MAEVGMRVVRGPDWQWGDQDGGEGYCGTIIEVGSPNTSSTPDRTVVVLWDIGCRTNYRVGYQSSYDLRLLDNAPVGVKHINHICDGCKKHCIYGLQWSCMVCFDYDLCTLCYMADKHDTSHSFRRIDNHSSIGIEVPIRKNSTKVPLQGIFVGAKVVRGPDWDWGNQDGGPGEVGRVTEIRGWDGESNRSVAVVLWKSSAVNNVYRIGHKGRVDLKCVAAASCGTIYINHLPVLGLGLAGAGGSLVASSSPIAAPQHSPPFTIGERVKVAVPLAQLKVMQEGHGGWNMKMSEYIEKIGVVHRITDKGDVRVQYSGCCTRWTIHPDALERVQGNTEGGPSGEAGPSFNPPHHYTPGDKVVICEEESKMRVLQTGHGEWIDSMRIALGKTGVVAKVYGDGDLRVNVDGKTWTVNPLCVVPNQTVNHDHNGTHHDSAPPSEQCSNVTIRNAEALRPTQLNEGANNKLVDKLVREAAQGHLQAVNAILSTNPELLEEGSGGKTALQVCCHQGHLSVITALLDRGACTDRADNDGDTPLHYAAFGNQVEVLELLIKRGADINATNEGKCTALHVAVNKQHPACVTLLLNCEANANIQDLYGDTALHDAIGKDCIEIVESLTNWGRLNIEIFNSRGFNVLHHAALKGNNYATEKLLLRGRQFVDIRKNDGFGALHLACLNGHRMVAETLLSIGSANVNLTNNKLQTPLLLAIAQGHASVVEPLVVTHGADVNCQDEEGETALHLSLHKAAEGSDEGASSLSSSPLLCELLQKLSSSSQSVWLAVACLLIQNGANVALKNSRGVAALQSVTDLKLIETIQSVCPLQSLTSAAPSDAGLNAIDAATRDLHIGDERTRDPMPLPSNILNPIASASSQPASPAKFGARVPASVSQPVSPRHGQSEGSLCSICIEGPVNIRFEPCGHSLICSECAPRVKKCLQCQQIVAKKIRHDGQLLNDINGQPTIARLRYLENKIQDIEEAHSCSICMERSRSVAFLCGHSACSVCAQTLACCHMCRTPITAKIHLYQN